MAGPFWPKPPESDWEKARRERQSWEEDLAREAERQAKEDKDRREWEKQYREDIGKS